MLERQRRDWPGFPLLWPALLGLLGTLAMAVCAPQLVADPVRWFYEPRLGAGARVLFYAGMAAMAVAWLWLGRGLAHHRDARRELGLIAALWSLPLVVAPPLFSHDLFSYLAQGTIAHLGLSPYQHSPAVLGHLGHGRMLEAVSPFWRNTTAPYGPVFIALAREVVGLTGANLVLGVVIVRLLDLVGLLLLVTCGPRLAERLGASPPRAAWLVALNPLFLFALVAPGHNDLLMAGLMAAGVLVALQRRPRLAIGICALAATIKLPALAAATFVAVTWIRSRPDVRARARATLEAVALTISVLALAGWASGFGTDWISSSVFSTPNRVHLAITPSTALGWTVGQLAHDLGWHVSIHHLESGFAAAALALVALLALERLRRVELGTLPQHLGVVLIAFAWGGPAAWPWYFAWGIVLLAACPPGRLASGLVIGSLLGAFVVKPDGILALPISSAPAVLVVYAGLAAYAWRRRARRAGTVVHAAA